jgi:hypothetical protein
LFFDISELVIFYPAEMATLRLRRARLGKKLQDRLSINAIYEKKKL